MYKVVLEKGDYSYKGIEESAINSNSRTDLDEAYRKALIERRNYEQ